MFLPQHTHHAWKWWVISSDLIHTATLVQHAGGEGFSNKKCALLWENVAALKMRGHEDNFVPVLLLPWGLCVQHTQCLLVTLWSGQMGQVCKESQRPKRAGSSQILLGLGAKFPPGTFLDNSTLENRNQCLPSALFLAWALLLTKKKKRKKKKYVYSKGFMVSVY